MRSNRIVVLLMSPMFSSRYRSRGVKVGMASLLIAVSLLAVMVWQGVLGGRAQTPTSDATDRLRAFAQQGDDPGRVVARVNGRDIALREVVLPALMSGSGSDGSQSWQAALDAAIDHHLLVEAAEAAGIVVTEEEVDMMVSAASQPFEKGSLSSEDEALIRAAFEASGTSLEQAAQNEAYRTALRNMLLVGRFLNTTETERAELVASLRQDATIEVLEEPGEKNEIPW